MVDSIMSRAKHVWIVASRLLAHNIVKSMLCGQVQDGFILPLVI